MNMTNYVLKKWYKGREHRKFSYPKDVDVELVPMLDVFNNIPGVRTVFSCCGHGYPGWYIDFRTTSDFMFLTMLKYFDKDGGDLEFNVQTADDFGWNSVPEKRITIYCDKLGMMKVPERKREYARICEFFSQFAPKSEWDKVHEF